MNAEIQLTRSLKANGFVLARQDKHKIYRRDDGRIFVVPSTPSDCYRWAKNALADLQRVLAEPPRSELLSIIECQKKEDAIRLERQAKFNAGNGHTKQRSDGGNGFTYIVKKVPVLTPEQIEQSKAAAERSRKMQEGKKRVRTLQAEFVSFVRECFASDYEAAVAKIKEIKRVEAREVYDRGAAALANGHALIWMDSTHIKRIEDLPSFAVFLDESVRLEMSHTRDEVRKGVEIVAKSIAKNFDYRIKDDGNVGFALPKPTVNGDETEQVVSKLYHEWLEKPDAKETAVAELESAVA